MNDNPLVSPEDASLDFAEAIVRRTGERWPVIRSELALLLPATLQARPSLLDEQSTRHVLALAHVAVEMQALRVLLPAPLAERVIAEVIRCFAGVSAGGSTVSLLTVLDERWRKCIARDVNPVRMIGLTIAEYLEAEEFIDVDGEETLSPVMLSGLTALVVFSGVGWWKEYLATHSISEN
jgi:hypothetical protein